MAAAVRTRSGLGLYFKPPSLHQVLGTCTCMTRNITMAYFGWVVRTATIDPAPPNAPT